MKEKRDILFLCQYFYPDFVSSATLPFDTAVRLVEEGFTVSALTGYPKEYSLSSKIPTKETHKGVEIKRLKYLQLKRTNFWGRLINYFSFTISVALHFLSLANYKSIIVYSNPPILPLIAIFAKKVFKTKVIFVSYDVYPEIAYKTSAITEKSIISRLMIMVNKSIFKHVTKVVALSNEMKDYLVNNRPFLTHNQIEVIPNWYENKDLKEFSDPPQNKFLSSIKNDNNFVVSYFGNLGIAQDLDTILVAIRELKYEANIKFVFAGHGNKMETLKSIVENEKLTNVMVFDFLHGQDYQDALNISNCFLVSLSKGLTGLAVPSKTYGYMMAGKPVIAIIGANSDIAQDLIANNAGYTMEVGESSKLVLAIQELKNDKSKMKIMGENCRKVFLKKYTKENCTRKYVNLINSISED
ncbi:glycosyltransferase family 4 protein [Bacillus sp. B-jedd]|uniref:glycosyltransferase family 4 protein n=1 Tax=Bacillus sp. B-jedd TaxID=1476857 RepID=UPI000515559C|nr:glycosyltransferase family 4 protein [Bacillus sp. B-jedd]CEG29113.1 capsular polysaccharide synthesis enzyme Cap5L [Bacillus sp. B-jedd]